eukprot:sb/3478577/
MLCTLLLHHRCYLKTGERSVMPLQLTYEPTDTSKQPIRTHYLRHVTGYQPIRDQYFTTTNRYEGRYWNRFLLFLIHQQDQSVTYCNELPQVITPDGYSK